MKIFLIIVVTAALTWITVALTYGVHSHVEGLWMISAVKAPGQMTLAEIQADMNGRRYDVAKRKIEVLVSTWKRFNSGSDSFGGPGIGDIMAAFSKIDNQYEFQSSLTMTLPNDKLQGKAAGSCGFDERLIWPSTLRLFG